MSAIDHKVCMAMVAYGGRFVRAIANAYMAGDPENRAKIKSTWPEIWAKYAEMAKKGEA